MNQDPTLQKVEPGEITRRAFLATAMALGISACSGNSEGNPSSVPGATAPLPESSTQSEDPQLKLLEQYERELGVAPTMMNFIGFPETEEDAKDQAAAMVDTLKAWDAAGVRPIIIMEPTSNGQPTIDLEEMGRGEYDAALDAFFKTLKDAGITDKQLGTWVPLPESNTPAWNKGVTDPKLFITNVTKIARSCKQYFPDVAFSVMLDSQTFLPSPDPNWANGSMNPDVLKQYLMFEPGLIDSFGLQGFTWDNSDNASTFLSAQAAITGAKQLGVKHVWFNTGTYSTVHNPNGLGVIAAGSSAREIAKRRAEVLQGVLGQALTVQGSGLQVDFINIFGQDTLNTGPDGTGTADYHYGDQDMDMLRTFVDNAKAHRIPVSLFDTSS